MNQQPTKKDGNYVKLVCHICGREFKVHKSKVETRFKVECLECTAKKIWGDKNG